MNDEVDDALLHERLQTGAFGVTPPTEESTARLHEMIARAEQESRVNPRRLGLIVSSSLVAALLLGGAATFPGVIDIFRQTSPVQQQLFEFQYTLPSGAQCDAVYGVYADADPAAVQAIRQGTASPPAFLDDVDAVIADMRANPDTYVTDTGAREPGGYGSQHYNADSEYQSAVAQAIRDQLQNELRGQGFPADALGLNAWGEDSCPGATW